MDRRTSLSSSHGFITEPYNLGDLEYHLCLRVPGDYDEWRAYHRAMELHLL